MSKRLDHDEPLVLAWPVVFSTKKPWGYPQGFSFNNATAYRCALLLLQFCATFFPASEAWGKVLDVGVTEGGNSSGSGLPC